MGCNPSLMEPQDRLEVDSVSPYTPIEDIHHECVSRQSDDEVEVTGYDPPLPRRMSFTQGFFFTQIACISFVEPHRPDVEAVSIVGHASPVTRRISFPPGTPTSECK